MLSQSGSVGDTPDGVLDNNLDWLECSWQGWSTDLPTWKPRLERGFVFPVDDTPPTTSGKPATPLIDGLADLSVPARYRQHATWDDGGGQAATGPVRELVTDHQQLLRLAGLDPDVLDKLHGIVRGED